MKSASSLCLTAVASLVLAACAGGSPLRSYDKDMAGTVQHVKKGDVPGALAELEKNNQPGMLSKDKDILYYFEKGQLLSFDNQYAEAQKSWQAADDMVQQWENNFHTDPDKIFGQIGSFLVNDKTRRYEGQDYEKVMLTADLSIADIMQGKYDDARVDMKKTAEREQLIGQFREKEYDALQDKAKTFDLTSSLTDLKGYPMESLNTPDVTALKNGYQNAFAHYLAGYFFEAAGETSLSEPGYRNAVELAPGSALARASLDATEKHHLVRPGASESDVLFVIESGFAPSWKSITLPIPLPEKLFKSKSAKNGTGVVMMPMSFPVVVAENKGYVPPQLNIAGKTLGVDTLVNFDAMARRQLKDQLPGILLRTAIRGVLKAEAQSKAAAGGPIAQIATAVVAVATESADDRSWRTLPERISIARAILPQGEQTLSFRSESGVVFKSKVSIGSRFTIIPIRLANGGPVLVGNPSVLGDLPTRVSTEVAVEAPAAHPARAKAQATRKSRSGKAAASATGAI